MSTTATAQLDYYINLLIKNCNFDCLNSGEREGERKEAKGMWLNRTMSDSRNCCQENFMNFDKAGVCVCECVVCLPTSTCQQNNYYFRSKHTHTHRQTLTKSDWKLRQDTERHRKLFSKLEYTSGIVSKRVENSLLMSFNGYYILYVLDMTIASLALFSSLRTF